jgi:hypothetical protein
MGRRPWLGIGAAAWLLASALASAPAAADEYDPERAGHPLRVIAYLMHPIGVAFDYLLFRPAHWVGHHEPIRTIFGHRGYWEADLYRGREVDHPLPHSHSSHHGVR